MTWILIFMVGGTLFFFYSEYKKLKPTVPVKRNKSNLTTCVNCSMGFLNHLNQCPHCNYENSNKRKQISTSAAVLLGIIALFFLSYLINDKSDSSYSDRFLSINTCQNEIKPNLKNPASADFDTANAVVTMHEDNKISVYITVRATNSFNAVVPTNYSCWVKKVNGNYEVDRIEQVNY